VVENPANPHELTLAATYGLLHTNDGGKNWYYVCESEFSEQANYSGDPLLAALDGNALFVNVQAGLNVSRDQACTWSPALSSANTSIIDVTWSRGTPNKLLALLWAYSHDSVFSITESLDDGNSFHTLSPSLPLSSPLTLDVAPSDFNRIYVSGLDTSGQGTVMVSEDHARTWSQYSLPSNDLPYIAGIHPSNPDQLFIRTDSWQNGTTQRTANDALYYSADGGKTWNEVLRQKAKLLGFAWSPDGSRVMAGYGTPYGDTSAASPVGTSTPVTDPQASGVYLSPVDAFSFSKVVSQSVTGLRWTDSGIYVCASESEVGYALGFAVSPEAIGTAGLSPLLRLRDVRGPSPTCSQAQATCGFAWQTACTTLGASCGDGGPADADGGIAAAPGDGGAAIRDAGAGGASGATGAGAKSGGACQLSASGHATGWANELLVALAFLGLSSRSLIFALFARTPDRIRHRWHA
jgi:photosystem II stability/assembly factor-like uncharacterized protein